MLMPAHPEEGVVALHQLPDQLRHFGGANSCSTAASRSRAAPDLERELRRLAHLKQPAQDVQKRPRMALLAEFCAATGSNHGRAAPALGVKRDRN